MKTEFPATIELKISYEPEKFQLNFNICHTPDCDCKGVSIVLYNENKEIQFFLDFETDSYRRKNYSENETRILTSFIDFLKSEENTSLNINFFKRNYEYVKQKVKNRRDEINSFIPGILLLYSDILWNEDDLEINIDGKNYVVFDSYCVMPNCDCTNVALNFFEDINKLGNKYADFAFVYDYITGVYSDITGTSIAHVENIINIIPESLNNKFKNRHIQLKKEVKTDVERKIKEKRFVPNDFGKKKLGRNEPCHCGSGKKYKKCCLDKDVTRLGKAIKVDKR